jgi:hypothetical protein
MNNEIESELDEKIDQIAEKASQVITNHLIKWLVRTLIGLSIFGTIWYFYDWGIWLFWGYVGIATVSLALIFYMFNSLSKNLICEKNNKEP